MKTKMRRIIVESSQDLLDGLSSSVDHGHRHRRHCRRRGEI